MVCDMAIFTQSYFIKGAFTLNIYNIDETVDTESNFILQVYLQKRVISAKIYKFFSVIDTTVLR